jgi:glutamate-1-semialdehyde 2,1-aminomutase
MMNRAKSEAFFKESLNYIPGGVNSPVRAFRAVGGTPFFVDRASGAYLFDVDGNQILDYVGTWGPAILGHAHPKIIQAVQNAAAMGTSFGVPNPLELEMAKTICEAVPSVEKVRMCNSGTEATMSAIRLARGFTKRDKIIKFEGCYHGHADFLLVKAGSGALTFGCPDSAGVPQSFTQHTIVLPFNEIEPLREAFRQNPGEIAAIILEPVPGNAGLFLPEIPFLEELRKITAEHGTVLIYDEVMTGFRLSRGGAQELFGMRPDLSCFGKIIGGGLPVGAFGGRKEIMDLLAPLGPVYQAGTLSGNPLALSAGLTILQELRDKNIYKLLEERGQQLEEGMRAVALKRNVPVQFYRIGSMFCGYFCDRPVKNLGEAMRSDRQKFGRFFHGMLDRGIYLAPSQFEAGFISAAHSANDIDKTIQAADEALAAL